jgi:hypothetical protein
MLAIADLARDAYAELGFEQDRTQMGAPKMARPSNGDRG